MTDCAEKTKAFDKWVREKFTFVSDKFEIRDLRSSGEGRGLVATEDIKMGDRLFEISRDSILNVETAAITKLNEGVKDVLYALNQWQALIICLAYEWYLKGDSQLLPYLGVLPLSTEDFNSLMFWKDEELQLLKPSGVLKRIGKDAAEEMYAFLVADVIPNKIKCPELADFLTLERFHIVASLIMSYSFDVDHPEEVEAANADDENEAAEENDVEEGDKDQDGDDDAVDDADDDDEMHNHSHGEEGGDGDEAEEAEADPVAEDTYYKSMVPLADTLNSNTSLCNAKLNYEKTALVMIADKDIKKGEQIFNIYGELPNSEILRKYGYVELPSSKFEFAEIFTTSIKEYFQDCFAKLEHIKPAQAEKIVEAIFESVEESEYLAENLVDEMDSGILFEKYEIYSKGEVVPELLLLLLIVTSVLQAAKSDEKWFKKICRSVERKASSDLLSFIDRTILKSHQLLDEKLLLTQSTLDNINEILKLRIAEYPTHIIDGSYKTPTSTVLSRKEMADVVLANEVQCFKDVIDGNFPPKNEEGTPRFNIIEDDKFLKNLLKRKLEEYDSKANKKQRKGK